MAKKTTTKKKTKAKTTRKTSSKSCAAPTKMSKSTPSCCGGLKGFFKKLFS